MKVNNPNLSSIASAETSRAQETSRGGRPLGASQTGGSGDDVHLSELVRSLRSLASESPERQANIEKLARAYANGSYQVDAEALAGKVIDDAVSL
jgi:flagellar biosynthesis anti-sigma factor FlgM